MKKNKIKYFIIPLIIILTLHLSKPGEIKIPVVKMQDREYVSLYEVIRIFDLSNSYDIVTGRGKLFYKGSFAVYQTGISVVLVNGEIVKAGYPIIVKKGEIFIPLSMFEEIAARFYLNHVLKREGNFYSLYKKGKPAVDEGEKPVIKEKFDRERGEADRITFIIIDPGHGGKDPGAVAKGGLREKLITLDISKYLNSFLKGKLRGIKIKMTRSNDRFIELSKRTEIANKLLRSNTNGLFVSVHVNASLVKSVSGFETYFLSQNPSNEEARTTAALENNVVILEEESSRESYGDVDHIQALMLTTQIQKESSMLANSIQKQLDKKIWESKSKGVKKADFFVLRGALLPAVLVEVGFISNRKEAKNLTRKSYQKKVAEGIGKGIIDFINKYNRDIKK